MIEDNKQDRKDNRRKQAASLVAFNNEWVVVTLRRECIKEEVVLIERLNGHFQLEKTYLINYWPLSCRQTIYSKESSIGTIYNVTPYEAVMLATGVSLPPNSDR